MDLPRLNLKNQILVGYSLPVLLSFFSVFLVYSQVEKLRKQAQELDMIEEKFDNIQNLGFSILSMQNNARGYLLGKFSEQLTEYEIWDTKFYELSANLRISIKEPKLRKDLEEIINIGDRLNEFNRRLISYIELGKPEKASEVWQEGKVKNMTINLEKLIDELRILQSERVDLQLEKEEKELQLLIIIVFATTGISALLAFLIGNTIAAKISTNITQEASTISSSSSEITTTMIEQEKNASSQAAALNQMTTTIDELNISFQNSTAQIKATETDATKALNLSELGTEAVNKALTGMSILKEKVAGIAEQSQQLNEQSSEIENIISLVNQLSTQINILALNATIESIRANKDSQGFGVIANEIRSLAEKSRLYVGNISNLINEIQETIKTTVNSTNEGNHTATEAMQIVEEMAISFTGVTKAVKNVDFNNKQISFNTQQQAQALEQVVEAINIINNTAQENSQGITLVKDQIQKLELTLKNLLSLL
ncbi:MAG: methyl-accepting chemotaxis protein [Microcoleaceae cyanobacterium MO_207.B10]|nr:methyl-accepting chemotaxis protein [Microcoleaceae cyanobacterium MO_207.B10]